jgi:hypothetical protein
VLTPAPLPGWPDLLRALVRRPASDADLAAPWCRTGDLAGWLSRSAWSLALIVSWRKRLAARVPVSIWIPDFFCNSSLQALRATGASLTFYPVTESMAPDMAACRILREDGSPDIFVLVHYFGRPTATVAAREFCARTGAWLIEDAAHVLRPTRGVGTGGDFVLYSPHKHLPIPEGAVLVVRADGPGQFGAAEITLFGAPSSWADQLRDLQQLLGCSIAKSRLRTAVWLGKRAAQKLGLGNWTRTTSPYMEQASADKVDSPRLVAPRHGGIARRLLTALIGDLGVIARYRERHQLQWDALLLRNVISGSAPATATERPAHREWTPYLAGYRIDAENAEATYLDWRRRGLPVTTWPDLPPEVNANPSQYHNAWTLRHSRMYFPVHQSLQALDISRLFRLFEGVVETKPRLEFAWDEVTRYQWGAWLAQSGRSNLLQSWAYGAAKASTSAWRVTRGAISCAGEPIAFVQVLQRRVAGILKISRINRGPLYLRAATVGEQRAVWDELSSLGGLRGGRLLTVAPEAVLTGSSLLQFVANEFRQFSPRSWESLWLDLGLDLETLRKLLDSKWRNMLSLSERTSIELKIGSDDESFEWMLDRYRENMQDKNFGGPSIDFLRSLRCHLGVDSRPIILRALADSKPVAGICLVPHGIAATYLLGWNGDEGRNLKANQYLLWHAISHLKQCGLRWFDLGGIDEEQTPGIAAFKLGLNGQRYELVGEFWKW